MRLKPSWTAMLMLGAMAGTASAATPQDTIKLHQRALAAMCANCHGTDGRTVDGSAIPSLAGMPREYMVAQMNGLPRRHASGHRDAPAHQGADGSADRDRLDLFLVAQTLSRRSPT